MYSFLRRLVTFITLILVQVFILDKIHLFGYATPMLYVWFILTLGTDEGRNKTMLWAFAMGLAIDFFGNTFGIHAASATLLAFVRPALIRLFFIRNDGETFVPSIQSMGAGAFRGYALLGILLHHIEVFVLEYFSFDYLVPMAISLGSSVVLTMLFVMAVERIFGHRS